MNTQLRNGQGSRVKAGSPPPGMLLRIAGAGLLWATAGLHLDLYLTGYRTIPTIGPLFLFQVIVAFALGALLLVMRSRLAAAAGAGFALSTLGGYLLTVQFGLFGFREVRTTAGIVAGIIEVAAFAVLAVYAATPSMEPRTKPRFDLPSSLSVSLKQAGLGVAGVSLVALALTGGALAGAGSAASSQGGAQTAAGSGLRTATIGGVTVLVNASGRTLYSFAPDTSSKSACYGSCAAYWPPVTGPLKAGPGVTGRLATITRTGGAMQETYDGHPLYTYVGDSGPGQAHGNNLNLNGGLWHVVPVSG
jgi:predicted lipoprotein with Yx(FWY)xxD motif